MEGGEQTRETEGQRRSGDATQQAQDHALGEKLPDHVPPPRADGHADADLSPPGRSPGQEHARHVGAGDEQDEADEEHEARGQGHQDLVGRGMHAHAPRREQRHPAVLVGLRVGFPETGHDAFQVGPRLLDRDPGLEASLHEHPALAAPVEAARAAGRRHRVLEAGRLDLFDVYRGQPDLGGQHGQKTAVAVLDHPDYGVRLAAQAQRSSDRGGIGAHLPPPVAVRHHDHAFGLRAIVLRQQSPAHRGPDAQSREEVPRDHLSHDQARAVGRAERPEHRAVPHEIAEDGVPLLEVEVVGVRARGVGVAVAAARVDVHERLGRGHGQGPEEHRVDQAEKGAVETDGDGQGGHGGQGEAGAPLEPAESLANIGPEPVEHERDLLRQAATSPYEAHPSRVQE